MLIYSGYTNFGRMVEGLGDEEIPWWIAPYVRNFTELAKSQVLIDAQRNAKPAELALASLAQRLGQTAAVARVAAHVKGNEGLAAGVSATMADEIDEFCGTPPRPHHINQAGLVVSLIAASLEANDPAKAALVAQAERLQRLIASPAVAA
jgi:hypothetical protein